MPNVVGFLAGRRVGLLEDAGFVVKPHYVAGWGEMPGTVTGQDPVADSRAQSGDAVVIQVAVF